MHLKLIKSHVKFVVKLVTIFQAAAICKQKMRNGSRKRKQCEICQHRQSQGHYVCGVHCLCNIVIYGCNYGLGSPIKT